MVTDRERHEIAENLRYLSADNRVQYKEQFFELLDDTVMEPDLGYHEMNDVFERLADLIDRPTCHAVPSQSGPFINGIYIGGYMCSACGADTWCDASSITPYCPMCGAEVRSERLEGKNGI